MSLKERFLQMKERFGSIASRFGKKEILAAGLLAVVIVTLIIVSSGYIEAVKGQQTVETIAPTEAPTQAPPVSHMIPGAADKVLVQDELLAGCETYACTMLFNILGYDLDIFTFANNYLDCHPVIEDEYGNKKGPDLYSGFAGTAYAGWGVYSPSMAKSMNRYLKDQKSELTAYAYEDVPLETLCAEYIDNDIPVMVWATTDMKESFVYGSWEVNYVDENAKYKLGDTFEWLCYEHCLVLIGYDEDEYFFDDSAAGMVSHFKKDVVDLRYKEIGSQCIVVK